MVARLCWEWLIWTCMPPYSLLLLWQWTDILLLCLDQITHPFENGDLEVLFSSKESDFLCPFRIVTASISRNRGQGWPFTGSKKWWNYKIRILEKIIVKVYSVWFSSLLLTLPVFIFAVESNSSVKNIHMTDHPMCHFK